MAGLFGVFSGIFLTNNIIFKGTMPGYIENYLACEMVKCCCCCSKYSYVDVSLCCCMEVKLNSWLLLFHSISWHSSNVFARLPIKRFNKSQSGSIKYKCEDFSILERLYKLLFNKCLHLVIWLSLLLSILSCVVYPSVYMPVCVFHAPNV